MSSIICQLHCASFCCVCARRQFHVWFDHCDFASLGSANKRHQLQYSTMRHRPSKDSRIFSKQTKEWETFQQDWVSSTVSKSSGNQGPRLHVKRNLFASRPPPADTKASNEREARENSKWRCIRLKIYGVLVVGFCEKKRSQENWQSGKEFMVWRLQASQRLVKSFNQIIVVDYLILSLYTASSTPLHLLKRTFNEQNKLLFKKCHLYADFMLLKFWHWLVCTTAGQDAAMSIWLLLQCENYAKQKITQHFLYFVLKMAAGTAEMEGKYPWNDIQRPATAA